MYEQFFNLVSEPFRLTPDPQFCYAHNSYKKAQAYLMYALKRAEGFVMVTGRPGTGKTTLVRDLIAKLPADRINVAMLVSTQLEATDLLHMVANSFGIQPQGKSKSDLLLRLELQFLNWLYQGQRALLIIDEAQDLLPSAMEELRLLTNIQFDNQPLLQIFLLGQEEFRDMIQQKSMEQVHQRIVAACHLQLLSEEETKAYIKHRLLKAGWQYDPAISEPVYKAIHTFSAGIPRRINMICSRLLLHACVEELHKIGIADAQEVMQEIKQEQLTAQDIVGDFDFSESDTYEDKENDEQFLDWGNS